MIELKCKMTGEKELTVNAGGNFPELVAELGVALSGFLKAADEGMENDPAQALRDVLKSNVFWSAVVNGASCPEDYVDVFHSIAIQCMIKRIAKNHPDMSVAEVEQIVRKVDAAVSGHDDDDDDGDDSETDADTKEIIEAIDKACGYIDKILDELDKRNGQKGKEEKK